LKLIKPTNLLGPKKVLRLLSAEKVKTLTFFYFFLILLIFRGKSKFRVVYKRILGLVFGAAPIVALTRNKLQFVLQQKDKNQHKKNFDKKIVTT